ncbi:hypothetical protein AB0M43_15920 [Longispora sp. NPDC051575]|uniref:hypothetical protein n=1 Tax=Longispora sp. NPDC051575 TaxID=3154943 RepID=UPI003435747F
MGKPEALPSCAKCAGNGMVRARTVVTTYDKNGKPVQKETTRPVTCPDCKGKGRR